MLVNHRKPDPGEDDGLTDVVELVAVDDPVDNDGGVAEQPSRLRAWWGQVLEDAERATEGPRPRSLTRPELGAYNMFNRSGLATVKTGTVFIFRGSWTLTRCVWVLVVSTARKVKRSKTAPARAAAVETGDAAKAKVTKPAAAKKAPATKSSTGDVIVAGLLIAGMGVTFLSTVVVPTIVDLVVDTASWVGDHLLDVARGTGAVVIVFVMIAWIVGGVVGPQEDREKGHEQDHKGGRVGGANEEATEAESADDHEGDQGSGEAEDESDGGDAPESSPEDVERIAVFRWVRKSIKERGNGTAVHLREMALDTLPEGGDMRSEIRRVRARLEAQDITVRDGVKAPASDKGGATRNRPGVHSADLPQTFTPLPTQGSNLIRLLPTYNPSDQV